MRTGTKSCSRRRRRGLFASLSSVAGCRTWSTQPGGPEASISPSANKRRNCGMALTRRTRMCRRSSAISPNLSRTGTSGISIGGTGAGGKPPVMSNHQPLQHVRGRDSIGPARSVDCSFLPSGSVSPAAPHAAVATSCRRLPTTLDGTPLRFDPVRSAERNPAAGGMLAAPRPSAGKENRKVMREEQAPPRHRALPKARSHWDTCRRPPHSRFNPGSPFRRHSSCSAKSGAPGQRVRRDPCCPPPATRAEASSGRAEAGNRTEGRGIAHRLSEPRTDAAFRREGVASSLEMRLTGRRRPWGLQRLTV